MSSGYQILSSVYDRWQKSYGKDFSTLILPRVLDTIQAYRIPLGSMLDLACGTGTLALMMEKRGWRVWGVDGSEGMISQAKTKLTAGHHRIEFLRQDMRDLKLPEQVGLATSLFDSLNHLPNRRDLLTTFEAVYASLRDGGYFVFDLNNERCFKTLWTKAETIRHKDFTMVLQNSYDQARRTACSEVVLFEKNSEGYTRSVERVEERLFPDDEVRTSLEKAGFTVLKGEEFNFTPFPEVGKIKTWWVARK